MSLDSLNFTGIRCLRDDTIQFSKGITAIVGGNGVGKSTLAYASALIANQARGMDQIVEHSARLDGAQLRAQFTTTRGQIRVDYPAAPAAEDAVVANALDEGQFYWLDPSDLAVRTQQQIGRDADFRDLLEAAGSRALVEEAISEVSYLVGKKYETCEVWEIADYSDLPAFPYFRVTANGATYGSEGMGRGELALLICHWAVRRMADNAILVLEEPENHVSARSQTALMNFISSACAEHGLWVIITTHSSAITENLPLSSVRLLANTGEKSTLNATPHRHDVAAIIGGGVHHQNVIVTEDECGKNFLLSLCEILDKDLKYQIAAVSVGGEGNVAAILGTFPKPPRWPSKVVGVYDGDMRGKERAPSEWPVVYLPGNCAPEELLMGALAPDSTSAFAAFLGVSETDVHAAIDASTGLDHHDWHEVLAKTLGREKMAVTYALTRLWVERNRDTANTLISELGDALA